MLNVLRSDIYKLFKTKSFIIITLIALTLSCVTVFISSHFAKSGIVMTSTNTAVSTDNIDALNNMLSSLTVVNSINKAFNDTTYLLNICIFAAIFITLDFSSGAIKNIASKGLSRNTLYMSKLITVFVGTFIIMLISIVGVILSSLSVFELGELNNKILLDSIINISKQISLSLGMASVFVAIAYISRSNIVSIVSGVILVTILPSILSLFKNKMNINDYFIPNAISNISNLSINPYLLSLIYIVIATSIGILIFRRQDIK